LTMGSVFLAVSDRKEMELIKSQCQEVNITVVQNNPLGRKWQSAVDLARKHGAETIITCGSDDVLSNNYGSIAMQLVDQYDFIGLNHWHVTDGSNHYLMSYRFLKGFPAGSGRIFSKRCLDTIGWNLFDTRANRLLDDQAMNLIYRYGMDMLIDQVSTPNWLNVLAIKGNWQCLNPLSKFLIAPTIECEKLKELPVCFPMLKF
jgi:hypothetical protein